MPLCVGEFNEMNSMSGQIEYDTPSSNAVHFSHASDPDTGFLCNFYRSVFVLDNTRWPSSEHFYQAQKISDAAYATTVAEAPSPKAAKNLAHAQGAPVRADWDEVKLRVMMRAVVAKFCLAPDGRVELIERLLKTGDLLLVEASTIDSYWGAGADGNGTNHLGRVLMAVRGVLLRCDHEAMQRMPLDNELPEPATGDLIEGTFAAPVSPESAFYVRVAFMAWRLLHSPAWDPAYVAPGIRVEVLRGPLFGSGIRALRETFRPWLGVPLHAVWGEDSFSSPGLILQARDAHAAPGAMTHGLHIYAQWSWRFGLVRMQTVAAREAGADWREPWVESLPMPPWTNMLIYDTPGHRKDLKEDARPCWALHAVSVVPTPHVDDRFNRMQYFQPSALAIRLEFCVRQHDDSPALDAPHRFVCLYAADGDGIRPHVHAGDEPQRDLLPTLPWQLLLASEAMGALPKLEAAFATLFTHEGIELPAELVVRRQSCANMDDGWDGLTCWNIDVAFGRDQIGEFLDVDADHRMCGAAYHRIYDDGRRVPRDEQIDPARLQAGSVPHRSRAEPVSSDAEAAPAPNAAVTPLAIPPEQHSGRYAKRALGLLVVAIGVYLLAVMASGDQHQGQVVVLALVMIALGGWVIWRPDDVR